MKTRSSTPSHDTAAEPKANQPPQSRSNTPSLVLAAERNPARPPPTNPYRTPIRSTSPPRGDTTSPTLLSIDDDHRPPPPPAPDEGTAKRLSVSRDDGDLGLTVASRETGRQTTPLTKDIANDPISTVKLATKFPPEFFQEMEDQTVMSGMGGELDSEHTGDRRREASEFPQPGGFQALLDSEFPVAMATDATSEQIRAFLAKGERQADAARKEFDQVVTNF